MKYKYGEFTENQISLTKTKLRKQIFFLLLIVDPNTKAEYEGTVGEVHCCARAVSVVPLLGEVVVGSARHTVYL